MKSFMGGKCKHCVYDGDLEIVTIDDEVVVRCVQCGAEEVPIWEEAFGLLKRYVVLVGYMSAMIDEYIVEDSDDVDPYIHEALLKAGVLRVATNRLLKEVAK